VCCFSFSFVVSLKEFRRSRTSAGKNTLENSVGLVDKSIVNDRTVKEQDANDVSDEPGEFD
jgi:hypothetical protein